MDTFPEGYYDLASVLTSEKSMLVWVATALWVTMQEPERIAPDGLPLAVARDRDGRFHRFSLRPDAKERLEIVHESSEDGKRWSDPAARGTLAVCWKHEPQLNALGTLILTDRALVAVGFCAADDPAATHRHANVEFRVLTLLFDGAPAKIGRIKWTNWMAYHYRLQPVGEKVCFLALVGPPLQPQRAVALAESKDGGATWKHAEILPNQEGGSPYALFVGADLHAVRFEDKVIQHAICIDKKAWRDAPIQGLAKDKLWPIEGANASDGRRVLLVLREGDLVKKTALKLMAVESGKLADIGTIATLAAPYDMLIPGAPWNTPALWSAGDALVSASIEHDRTKTGKSDSYQTRLHLSRDGGATWRTVPIERGIAAGLMVLPVGEELHCFYRLNNELTYRIVKQ
jgi:hypothetical protein